MALSQEDSKAVSKAIQDAMMAAVKSLGGQTKSIGGGKTPRNDDGSKADKASAAKNDKIILATTGKLEELRDAAKASGTSLSDLSKKSDKVITSFGDLKTSLSDTMKTLSLSRAEIRKINFGGIADEIEGAIAKSLSNLKAEKGGGTLPTAEVSKFAKLLEERANPRLATFSTELLKASKSIQKLLSSIETTKSSRKAKPTDNCICPEPAATRPGEAARKSSAAMKDAGAEQPKAKAKEGAKPSDKDKDKGLDEKTGGLGKAFEGLDDKLNKFGTSLGQIGRTIMQVVDDAFQVLAARGYGTTDSLIGLYGSAITAGMSLREYAQMMDQNMIAVSRASSFAEFQSNLKAGTDGLKKFGVFGEDAANMAGAMMSASTSLGVPQAQMKDAMAAQTASFEKLRKTTNITATQFAELTKTVSEDANVRTELSALAPEERVKRQSALVDQAAYARSLNLSTNEVQKYTQSILDQRKSTVKQRFQQAGRLTQAAGMLGMDQGKVDELRKLSMNKYKTADEQKRYQALLGEVNTGIEKMQQSGQPGSQYQADVIRENVVGAGVDLDTAAAIKAGKESGEVVNKDLGKQLGTIAQGLGSLLTFIEGVMKNPLGPLAATLIGGLAAIGFGMKTLGVSVGTTAGNIIADKIIQAQAKGGKLGGAGGMPETGREGRTRGERKRGRKKAAAAETARRAGNVPANTPTGVNLPEYPTADETRPGQPKAGQPQAGQPGQPAEKPQGKIGGALKGAGGALKGAARSLGPLGAVAGIGIMAYQLDNAEENAKEENGGDGDVGKLKGEAIGEGIGAAAGTVIGGAIGSVVPVVGTAIGATLGGLLGTWGGKLLGGLIGSESAAEKQARETKKNTDEMIKSRRATAGSDTVSADNLGSLSKNVMQSARAYTAPTDAEVAKYAESKKTPEQKAKEKADKEAAAVKNMSQDEKNALRKQAKNEVYDGSNPNATEGDVEKKYQELLKKKAAATVAEQAKTDESKVQPGTDESKVQAKKAEPTKVEETAKAEVAKPSEGIFSSAASAIGSFFGGGTTPTPALAGTAGAGAISSLAQQAQSAIATPVSQIPSSVNPAVVNKAEVNPEADAAKKAAAAAIQSPAALSDPSGVLNQILDILKQSLIAENQQVELASTMLRGQSMAPYLPDKQSMLRKVMAQV